MKKLGFGLMRLPSIEGTDETDIKQLEKMVDMFIDRGFTYFDTAWMYTNYKSEDIVKEVLTKRHSLDSYTLATKLHAAYIKTKSDRDDIFSKQLIISTTICSTTWATLTTTYTKSSTALSG